MDLIQNMAFYVPFALLAEQPYPIFHLKKAPTSSYLWGQCFSVLFVLKTRFKLIFILANEEERRSSYEGSKAVTSAAFKAS